MRDGELPEAAAYVHAGAPAGADPPVRGDIPNVEVENWSGLLADFVRSKDAHILVKGVRNCADWELEAQMARINGGICPGLETVLLPASAAYEHFSSTMVREMIRYHQPLEKYVPAPVAEELMRQRG